MSNATPGDHVGVEAFAAQRLWFNIALQLSSARQRRTHSQLNAAFARRGNLESGAAIRLPWRLRASR